MRTIPRVLVGVLSTMIAALLATIYFEIDVVRFLQIFLRALFTLSGFLTLAIGIVFLVVAVVVEWNAALNHRRLQRMSLADVECVHPRFPRLAEMIMTAILTVVLGVLFFQFAMQVFAMAYSLSSSTTETKHTAQVVTGDFDGDGDIDYISFDSQAAESYSAYINSDGNGSFAYNDFGTGDAGSLKRARVGDLDGDGDLDILQAEDGGGTSINKFINNGSASFTRTIIATGGPLAGLSDFALVDVDGDGDLDFAAISSSQAIASAVWLNNGQGTFTQVASSLPASGRIESADMNSDGKMDLILGFSTFFRIFQNSGTGAFTALQDCGGLTNTANYVLALGDLDGDGDIDMMVSNTPAQLRTCFNDGSGNMTLTGTAIGAVDTTYGVALGDVDNDGDLDAILAASDGTGINGGNEIWLNNGAGSFSQSGTPTEEADDTRAVAVGDIDGDGDLDYIAGNYGDPAEVNRHYKSDQAATSVNTAPTAPSAATMTGSVTTATSSAGLSGGTFVSDASIGSIVWGNPSNASASDNVYAEMPIDFSGPSQALKATNFGFSIPTNATIRGIVVEVERKAGTGDFRDYAVRIVKRGSIGSTDKSTALAWPTVDTYETYGSPTDLWGETWTASDINGSTFGFAISAQQTGTAQTVSIDHIRIIVYYEGSIRLSWGSGSDLETGTRLLQYQLKVGTGSNTNNIVSGVTGSPYFVSRLVPNGQSRRMDLKNLPCGHTYYWNVATVDTGFRKTWGTEQQFTLSSSCGLTFSEGGSSPASSSAAGGGLDFRIFQGKQSSDSVEQKASLTVLTVNDLNANGMQDGREQPLNLIGLPLTLSGTSLKGTHVRESLSIGAGGRGIFRVPVSDARGYQLLVDTGSAVMKDYVLTHPASFSGIVLNYVPAGARAATLTIGLRKAELIDYRPCLTIGIPEKQETAGTDAWILLQRLEDVFGNRVMRELDLGGSLVTRNVFFTLLQRTHCVDLPKDMNAIKDSLRIQAKNLGITLPLFDLPLSSLSSARIVYALLLQRTDVSRPTLLGAAADLQSPITRKEAIHAVFTLLKLAPETVGTLPDDLEQEDPLTSEFLALQRFGILPESFFPILGANQGIDSSEAMLLLARAAFRAGKISMVPEVRDTKAMNNLRKAPSTQTFLGQIPPLKPFTCLEKDAHRSSTVSFTDVLPGDLQYGDVRTLLTYFNKNDAGHILWLIPATQRPTEFGITRGQTRIGLEEPVSILEAIRNLLVLSCLPPAPRNMPQIATAVSEASLLPSASSAPSAFSSAVLNAFSTGDHSLSSTSFSSLPFSSSSSSKAVIQGTGETRIARDKISDLQRDDSFASRVMYRAQDHRKEFDLSIFTYAPHLLRNEVRSPASPLSIQEGADLFSSALLGIAVKSGVLTPQQAENHTEALSNAILTDLLGTAVDWRTQASLKDVPLTRSMLLSFLITVLERRTTTLSKELSKISLPSSISLGEVWWERVR